MISPNYRNMKIAYIAHPVGGDVDGNIKKIIAIIRKINLSENDTVPFAPYLSDLFALDDNTPHERERGIRNDHEFFERNTMDELRLYGDRISYGMLAEIKQALNFDIPIKAMTPETEEVYETFKQLNILEQ